MTPDFKENNKIFTFLKIKSFMLITYEHKIPNLISYKAQ